MSDAADRAVLRALHRACFDADAAEVRALRGDGSDRRIYRLTGTDRSTIGIVSANTAENRAFVSFSRAFRSRGLAVPEIYRVAADEAAYLEEDLGDVTLHEWARERFAAPDGARKVEAMYARVLRELPRFQIDAADAIDYGCCYQYPEFGAEAMRFDIRYFREMFLDTFFAGAYDAAGFEGDAETLVARCLGADRRYFLYRDFQSRNIMLAHGAPHFIDYQSGRRGALHYDVASLLYDARAEIPPDMRARLRDGYIGAVAERVPVDRGAFIAMYDAYAVLRVMQALGAFGNLGIRKGKRAFLEGIPPGLANLRHLARETGALEGLASLHALFSDISAPSALTRIHTRIGEE